MEFVLYCKLEAGAAIPDYGSARTCVLLTGVKPADFDKKVLSQGVEVFVIETDVELYKLGLCENDDCPCRAELRGRWIKLTLVGSPSGATTVYRAFLGAAPEFFNLIAVEVVDGPELPDFPESDEVEFEESAPSPYTLSGFEVGQGMASLIYNPSFGYLVDAGAGTPIKRPNYLLPSFHSDLIKLVTPRDIKFFLSHADSDHWRMLVWDGRIETKVLQFFVPNGMTPLVFFDAKVKSRTRRWSTAYVNVPLGSGQQIEIMRTSPPHPTSNNDGLVLLFDDNSNLGLLPGDCVYNELAVDGNAKVRTLAGLTYAAVVVPHHGDTASAKGVPSSLLPSKAFFSAGNHTKYRHPSKTSVTAHGSAGYTTLVNKTPSYIREVRLI